MAQTRDNNGRFVRVDVGEIRKIEADVSDAFVQIGKQGAAIESLANSVGQIARNLDKLNEKLDQKTSWDLGKLVGGVVGVVMLVLAVVAVMGEGDKTRLHRAESYIDKAPSPELFAAMSDTVNSLERRMESHVSNGHPFTVIERTETNRRELQEIRRLMDEVRTTRFTNQDGNRHRDMIAAIAERLASVEAALKNTSKGNSP